MKKIFQIVVVAVFVFSCKSELSKIDINQVELHRKYQDSILDLSKNADSNLMSLKMLISDYKNLKIDRIRYYKRKGFLNSCKDGEFDESFVVKHH